MNDNDMNGGLSTEEKIFKAARDIFHRKGYDGARMQEIADKAGINKSMLHYYYRSKDKLFEKVYQLSLTRALPQVITMLNRDLPLRKKLELFTLEYLKLMRKNPDIPSFLIHELNTNPSRIQEFFISNLGSKIEPFINQIREAADKGQISKGIEPEHVISNTISLIIFPFIGKPILQILFDMDEESFTQFIDRRIEFLPGYIADFTLDSGT